jgi:hypothetical protein
VLYTECDAYGYGYYIKNPSIGDGMWNALGPSWQKKPINERYNIPVRSVFLPKGTKLLLFSGSGLKGESRVLGAWNESYFFKCFRDGFTVRSYVMINDTELDKLRARCWRWWYPTWSTIP